MQIENSNLEKKEGIYITSPEIIEKVKKELPELITEYNDIGYLTQKKFNLPSITLRNKLKNKLNLDSLEEETKYSNFHPCFSKENFYNYYESCNKFHPRMDHILKDGLSPRNIILKTRKFNKEEKTIISDLKKDEIIQRSLGQGMFMRIQKYKMLNKKNPFKLIISSLEPGNINYNEKEKKISQTNSFKKKNMKPKIYHLYNENNKKDKNDKKNLPRKSSILIAPLNELLRFDKPPSLLLRPIDNTSNLIKLHKMKNKIRDNIILNALEKCGEGDKKYLIGI